MFSNSMKQFTSQIEREGEKNYENKSNPFIQWHLSFSFLEKVFFLAAWKM